MLKIKFKLNKKYYYVHLSGTHSNKIIKKLLLPII